MSINTVCIETMAPARTPNKHITTATNSRGLYPEGLNQEQHEAAQLSTLHNAFSSVAVTRLKQQRRVWWGELSRTTHRCKLGQGKRVNKNDPSVGRVKSWREKRT